MTKLQTNDEKNFFVLSRSVKAFALSTVAVLTGCTTQLTATKVSGSTNSIEGQIYNLPRAEYSVELERELKSCSMQFDSDPIAAIEWLRDQADLINSRTDLSIAQKDFEDILKDPVLKLANVKLYFDHTLEAGWENKYKPKKFEDQNKLKDYLAQNVAPEQLKLNLEVAMRTTVTPVILPDPKQVYAIHYSGMMEKFKKTDYAAETYPNGTLKSINVTLDDQTGTIIQSVLQGAAKVASANIGIPASSRQRQALTTEPIKSFDVWLKEKQSSRPLCSAETRLKLSQEDALVSANADNAQQILGMTNSVTKQEKVVAKATKALDDENKKLAAIDAKDTAGQDKQKKVVETAKAAADEAQRQLDMLKKSQQALTDATAKSTDQIAKVRKQLTLTSVSTFSPEPATWQADGKTIKDKPIVSIKLDGANEALKAWLDKSEVAEYCQSYVCTENWPGNALESLYAEAAIYPPFTELSSVPPPTSNSVVYRQPVHAMIYVCKESSCLNSATGKLQAQQKDILLSSAVDVPQMGVIAALPLINTAFQNNTLTAEFAETGALTKLKYVTNATAAAAADTFNKSADTYLKYKEAKRTQQKDKLDQAKAEVDADTALKQSQLENEKATAALANYRSDNANTSSGGASNAAP